jgi:serine protease
MKSNRVVVRSIVVGLCVIGAAVQHGAAQGSRPQQGGAASSDTRYIVKFKPTHDAAGRAAIEAAGGRIELALDPQDAVAARIPAAALSGLQNNPHVDYIEEDAIREPYGSGSGETVPYGITMVQADKVTTSAATSKMICIIDSGYSQQHEDLVDASSGLVTSTATTGTGTWDHDSCGHGSHVAGTISAVAGNGVGVVGVDPGVRLHIVKVFGDDNLTGGNCSWTFASTLVAALNDCTAAGANIVSMSLGGTLKSRTEDTAFANAYSNGVLSIAAAGNGGNTRVSYPAGYASVLSVAAIDANQQVASFSQRNSDVELAAPGVGVLSTVPWNDLDTLTADSITWTGSYIDGAARTAGTSGAVVDGGQCTSVGAWAGKTVLCQRGTNSFAQKVANVKSGGGVAAAIYNSAASDPFCGVFEGTLNGTSTIPAIGLSCADGGAALAHAGSAGTVVSQFSAPASGYEAWDGTSMATPHVSGVAALVWSCFPALSNDNVRQLLDATAKDLGAAGRDSSYGYGLVQAKPAVQYLANHGVNLNCTILP